MYTVGQFKNKVFPKLHGGSLAKLQGSFYDKCKEAMMNVHGRIDITEQKRSYTFIPGIFRNEYEYVAPDDLQEDAIVALRPTGGRYHEKYDMAVYTRDFDVERHANGLINVRNINGVKTIRINKKVGFNVTVNPLTDPIGSDNGGQGNGDLIGSASVSNLSKDNFLFWGPVGSSIVFDVDSSGNAVLTDSNMQSIDLTNFFEEGFMFMVLYWPDAPTTISNVTLQWGSSPSDYWQNTVTNQFAQLAFSQYKNTLGFNWNGAAVTGTPDMTKITYMQLTLNYTGGAHQRVHINNLQCKRAAPYEMDYYTKFGFRDQAGNWKEQPTSDTDIIWCDTFVENIYFYEFLRALMAETQGKSGSFDNQFYSEQLDGRAAPRTGRIITKGLYDIYSEKYPSDRILPSQKYHNFDENMQAEGLDSSWFPWGFRG